MRIFRNHFRRTALIVGADNVGRQHMFLIESTLIVHVDSIENTWLSSDIVSSNFEGSSPKMVPKCFHAEHCYSKRKRNSSHDLRMVTEYEGRCITA